MFLWLFLRTPLPMSLLSHPSMLKAMASMVTMTMVRRFGIRLLQHLVTTCPGLRLRLRWKQDHREQENSLSPDRLPVGPAHPDGIQTMRSHYCGALTTANIDETVTLCGWVDRRRDHGGVIFLDMRDRGGIVQVVFDPDTEEHFQRADRVRSEYVLKVTPSCVN